jgi:hypothetical protein
MDGRQGFLPKRSAIDHCAPSDKGANLHEPENKRFREGNEDQVDGKEHRCAGGHARIELSEADFHGARRQRARKLVRPACAGLAFMFA